MSSLAAFFVEYATASAQKYPDLYNAQASLKQAETRALSDLKAKNRRALRLTVLARLPTKQTQNSLKRTRFILLYFS